MEERKMLETSIVKYATGYTMANKNRIVFSVPRKASDPDKARKRIFRDIEAQM